MTEKKLFIQSAICVFIMLCPPLVHARDARLEHKLALKAAKRGQMDFAYMHYREILRNHPSSGYHERAHFAEGEYFFYIPNYPQAEKTFISYLVEYSDKDSRARIMALAYLYKIAELNGDKNNVKRLAGEIVSFKQLSLVFKDHKEIKFMSPFRRACRAVFYIDKVEFFIEDELFVKITY